MARPAVVSWSWWGRSRESNGLHWQSPTCVRYLFSLSSSWWWRALRIRSSRYLGHRYPSTPCLPLLRTAIFVSPQKRGSWVPASSRCQMWSLRQLYPLVFFHQRPPGPKTPHQPHVLHLKIRTKVRYARRGQRHSKSKNDWVTLMGYTQNPSCSVIKTCEWPHLIHVTSHHPSWKPVPWVLPTMMTKTQLKQVNDVGSCNQGTLMAASIFRF